MLAFFLPVWHCWLMLSLWAINRFRSLQQWSVAVVEIITPKCWTLFACMPYYTACYLFHLLCNFSFFPHTLSPNFFISYHHTTYLCVGIDEVHPFSVSIQTLCNKTLNSHLPDNEVHTMGTATQPAGLHPCFTQQASLMIPILKQEQYYWTYPTNITGMLQTVSHNDFNTVRRYLQYKLK